MKIVRKISTGNTVYYQSPDFEVGIGIKNAVALFGGAPEDYEESEVTNFNAKVNKIVALESLYSTKYYSNVSAEFPSGTKVIQLRDDSDFRAFERVVLASVTRQAARRENAMVSFRTEDNVTQTLPASEFIPVALDILDAKQAIWKVKTAHKDIINELTEEQASVYDETAGWPETNEPVWVMEERASKIYKDMIRRRANRAMESGDDLKALTILKAIGE